METKKKNLKRLNIEMQDEIHTVIKTSASVKGISIRKWVLRAIMEQIRKDEEVGLL